MNELFNIFCDECWKMFGDETECIFRGMPGHQPEDPTGVEDQDACDDSHTHEDSQSQNIGSAYSLPENSLGSSSNAVPDDGWTNRVVLGTDDHPPKKEFGRSPGSNKKPKDPSAPPKEEKRPVGRPRGPNYDDPAIVKRRENMKIRKIRKRAEALKKEDGTSAPAASTLTPLSGWAAPPFASAPVPVPPPVPAPTLDPLPMVDSPIPEQVASYFDENLLSFLAPVAEFLEPNSTQNAQDMQWEDLVDLE